MHFIKRKKWNWFKGLRHGDDENEEREKKFRWKVIFKTIGSGHSISQDLCKSFSKNLIVILLSSFELCWAFLKILEFSYIWVQIVVAEWWLNFPLKWAIPGLFFVYFRLFSNICENVHPVYGAGIRTQNLQNMSLLPWPLDQGSSPSDGLFT